MSKVYFYWKAIKAETLHCVQSDEVCHHFEHFLLYSINLRQFSGSSFLSSSSER